jgi:hypothetical protein
MVAVAKRLSLTSIKISLTLLYNTLLDYRALSWTLDFNRVLAVHPNVSLDLV